MSFLDSGNAAVVFNIPRSCILDHSVTILLLIRGPPQFVMVTVPLICNSCA